MYSISMFLMYIDKSILTKAVKKTCFISTTWHQKSIRRILLSASILCWLFIDTLQDYANPHLEPSCSSIRQQLLIQVLLYIYPSHLDPKYPRLLEYTQRCISPELHHPNLPLWHIRPSSKHTWLELQVQSVDIITCNIQRYCERIASTPRAKTRPLSKCLHKMMSSCM